MKLLRGILWALLGLIVLIAIAVGVLFVPAVQRALLLRAVAGQPGFKLSAQRVAFGPRHGELDGVQFRQPGLNASVARLTVDYSLWAALMQRRIVVHDLVVSGAQIDLSPPPAAAAESLSFPAVAAAGALSGASASAPSAPAAVPAAFNGVLGNLRLPVPLTLDHCQIDGTASLPGGPGAPPLQARFTLSGGGVGAGRESRFEFQLTLATPADQALVRSLAASGTLTAALTPDWRLDHLSLATSAEARGPRLPQGAHLQALLSLARTPAGESYSVVLDSLGGIAAKQLLSVKGDYLTGSATISGTWNVEMGREDVLPFAFGWPLPRFDASGDGRFTVEPAAGAVRAQGRFSVDASELGTLRPALAALGHLRIFGGFDVAYNDRTARVERLDLNLGAARPVVEARALQPFEFDFSSGELRVADAAKDLFNVTLAGVPLAWLQPFLGGVQLQGDDLQGEFVASARNNGFAFRAVRPLRIGGLAAASAGRPLARDLTLELSPSASYWPQGWQADTGRLTVSSGGATLFTLDAKAGRKEGADQPVIAVGDYTLNLAGLGAQPALAAIDDFQQGAAAGQFSATLAGNCEVQATARLTGLVDKAGAALPAITCNLRVDLGRDGSLTLRAPLSIQQGASISDATITARILPTAAGHDVNARIDSSRIAIDDLLPFARAFGAAPPPAAAPAPAASASATPAAPAVVFPVSAASPPSPVVRDTRPPWAGLTGSIGFDLQTLSYANRWSATQVSGVLNLAADRAWIDQAGAQFTGGSNLALSGSLRFAATATDPYALAAKLTLSQFNPAPLFEAIDPTKLPAVDGFFDVTADLQGQGRNLADLAQRTHGVLTVTSKGGKFRALGRNQTAQTTSALTGFIGSLTNSKELSAVSQLTAALQEFPYDQLNVHVTRDPALTIHLDDFSLLSPDIRLLGQGTVAYAPGKPILDQPLTMQLQMSAQGNLAALLGSLGKLSDEKDALGYSLLQKPFAIGGTLARPDTSAFHAWLQQAAVSGVEKAADRLFDLFGRKKDAAPQN